MILPTEYFWLESFLNNDSLWFEDSLNWEDAFNLVFNEWTLYSFFTTPFFFNSYFFTDYITKLSILDIIFLLETDKSTFSREFFDCFIWDITNYIQVKYLPAQYFFYTDYQDFVVLMMYYSPELMLGFMDYFNNFLTSNAASYIPNVVYDLFSDHMNSAIIELVEHFIMFFSFIWIVVIFVSLFKLIKWSNSTEIYFVRLYMYFYNVSKDFRLQFEAVIQTFFFIFFFWTMMISTFDDDKEELIEFFDINCFYFFFLIIFYLLYKYSLHYFSFLEASVTGDRSISFVAKQFFRDFINTFALFLRFFILVFRLNVYDTLDDFYDSYYIYVGDFDDDEYYFEVFFFYQALFVFSSDNNDDGNFSLEDENDFFFDLFYLYFLCWAKLFTFLFFILEEILRLALAFYICYLIIFEVHAVNSSYIEDTYFFKTREKLKRLVILPFFKSAFKF